MRATSSELLLIPATVACSLPAHIRPRDTPQSCPARVQLRIVCIAQPIYPRCTLCAQQTCLPQQAQRSMQATLTPTTAGQRLRHIDVSWRLRHPAGRTRIDHGRAVSQYGAPEVALNVNESQQLRVLDVLARDRARIGRQVRRQRQARQRVLGKLCAQGLSEERSL